MTSCPPPWRTSITMRRMKAASSTTRIRAMSLRMVGRGDENLRSPCQSAEASGDDVDERLLDLVLRADHLSVGAVGHDRPHEVADLLGQVARGGGEARRGGRGPVEEH